MMIADALRPQLADWLSRVLRSVSPANAAHMHADELIKAAGLHGCSNLEVAWVAEAVTISLLGEETRRYMAVLSIDLEVSDVLDTNPPDLEHLESQLCHTPPAIYVFDRAIGLLLSNGETYRRPLQRPQLFGVTLPDVYFSYGCGRSEEERAKGWEYNRGILGEHYPAEFRPDE